MQLSTMVEYPHMKTNNSLWIEIVGWYGVLAILIAYVLLSFGAVVVNGILYQALNLTGSMGVLIVATRKKDYQPIVLNVIWGLVALVSLVMLMK